MFIKRLQMLNYRNYNALDIGLGPHVNVFMGDNAQGKKGRIKSRKLELKMEKSQHITHKYKGS